MAKKKGGWVRGARPGNYTDMQLMIACLIGVGGSGYSGGNNPWNPGASRNRCSFGKQAAIKLGYLAYGDCGKTKGPSGVRCDGAGSGAPAGAFAKNPHE